MLLGLLIFVACCTLFLYIWQKHHFSYWQRHNVKYIQPKAFVGNFMEVATVKSAIYKEFQKLYNSTDEPLIGIYFMHRPALLLRDLDVIKRILVRDFNQFSDRVLTADPIHDPLASNNLVFAKNPKWKDLRSQLSPVYTSGKIKQMYPLMVEVANELEEHLNKIHSSAEIDIKNICIRYTTDVIATTAFGLRSNSLRDTNNSFYKLNANLFELTLNRALTFMCFYLLPKLVPVFGFKLFSKEGYQFLRSTIGYALKEREKSGQRRNDLIDNLCEMKNMAAGDPTHPANDPDYLVAQAAIFNSAGFETSSSTMSFALYELAHQTELQERLRQEILAAFVAVNSVYISYEKLQELPYLDQVLNETLRKYPILAHLERKCTPQEGTKGYSLQPYYDFEVEADTPVFVSVLGIHRDEKYWADPENFDPDRFAPENHIKINWYAYMPFGMGPRHCVGMRMGLLKTKLGLVHFLRNHRVLPSKINSNKMEYDPRSPLITKKGNVILLVERIE